MIDIQYSTQKAIKNEIFQHLKEVETNFIPNLSTVVDIKAFSKKIYEKAIRFEAWSNKKLVGLLSAYFSNTTTGEGFINHIAVENDYKRLGISKILVAKCIEYALENNFHSIKLEVATENRLAIKLYKSFGFIILTQNNSKIQMENNLII